MIPYADLVAGLANLLHPWLLLTMVGGVFIGLIVGVLPGLGAATGMALLLPIVFYWPPEFGLILLTVLWQADNFGGSICSILLGVPGSAGAIITMEDGHPMAKQGKGAVAIGLALSASAVGGIIGALAFLAMAPPIAMVGLMFGSGEYFLLAILGLSLIATASKGNIVKSLVAACVGLLFSFVGIHIISGYPRFSFGTAYLLGGLDVPVVILGVFAIGMLLDAGAEYAKVLTVEKLQGSLFQGMRQAFRYPITLLRSGGVGALIGAMPGTGVVVATALVYQQTVSMSKHPETFGKGDPEGVVAPETSNNAVQGGALIPALTLGIPGSVSCAVFMGGLMMYGVHMGPRIFIDQGVLVWTIWWALIASVFCFAIFAIVLKDLFAKLTVIPFKYLIPVVFVLVIGGAYSANNNPLDIVAMLVIGVLGYFLMRHKYPMLPLMLAFILGPMAEENFFRSLIISQGSYSIFFRGIINPILIALIILSLVLYFRGEWKTKRRQKSSNA